MEGLWALVCVDDTNKYSTNIQRQKYIRNQIQRLLLETGMPYSLITFPTPLVNLLHSLHWFANATAIPIKWCSTRIPSLSLPLTVYIHSLTKFYYRFHSCKWISSSRNILRSATVESTRENFWYLVSFDEMKCDINSYHLKDVESK